MPNFRLRRKHIYIYIYIYIDRERERERSFFLDNLLIGDMGGGRGGVKEFFRTNRLHQTYIYICAVVLFQEQEGGEARSENKPSNSTYICRSRLFVRGGGHSR